MKLVFAFFFVALLYASVGFGGGSTYSALLALADVDYRLLPIISLACNILVVSGGVYLYWRAGYLSLRFALPFVALSMPMAFVGGLVPISRELFLLFLGAALLLASVTMWFRKEREMSEEDASVEYRSSWLFGLISGALIGFVSGLVGIGGGIFLAPLLHLRQMASSRQIAATSSFFILVNSIAGLLGQFGKQGSMAMANFDAGTVWLFVAVVIGGQIGSRLGIKVFEPRWVRRVTALLVGFVGLRLLSQSILFAVG